MIKVYYRVTYEANGIYDALKKEIWKKCENPKEEWEKLKMSEAFSWLKLPDVYYENCLSYFTEVGYEVFKIKTYPVLKKYLDEEKIKIIKYDFDELKIDVLYIDEHQIVIRREG